MTLDGFSGINAGYVLELYDRFRADPLSVDEKTRALFETWRPTDAPTAERSDGRDVEVAVAASRRPATRRSLPGRTASPTTI